MGVRFRLSNRMESVENPEDILPEFEPEDEINEWSSSNIIESEIGIERIKREMKAELKKSENIYENNIYKWLGLPMKIKITDNRILCGTFVCTDKDQNIILQNTEEFVTEKELNSASGRVVGMVMIPGEHIEYIKIKKNKKEIINEEINLSISG